MDYNPTTPEGIAARLTDLRAKLAKRSQMPASNWGENCRAIEAEIARLEALQQS